MDNEIFEKAKEAAQYAYAPYSKFKVGAAILLKKGNYILGCNVENVSFSLSNCAERTALFKMISQGYDKNDVLEMAIYADTDTFISPCGACRQVMLELLNKDTKIYLLNKKLESKEVAVGDLLPMAFDSLE